jgi:hypothetical protein
VPPTQGKKSNKAKCLQWMRSFSFTRNPSFLRFPSFFFFFVFLKRLRQGWVWPLGTPQNTTQTAKWSGIPGGLLRLHHRLRWHPYQSIPYSSQCQCPDLALPQAWKNPALLTRGHPSEGSLMTAQDVDLGFMR